MRHAAKTWKIWFFWNISKNIQNIPIVCIKVEYKCGYCETFDTSYRSLSPLWTEKQHFRPFFINARTFLRKSALGPGFFLEIWAKIAISYLVISNSLQKRLGSRTFQTFLKKGPAYLDTVSVLVSRLANLNFMPVSHSNCWNGTNRYFWAYLVQIF